MEKIAPISSIDLSTHGPLVVAPVYDGLCTFEFAIVAEIFGLSRPEMGPNWYQFSSAAIEPGPLRAHGGLTFTAESDCSLIEKADLIVIAGWKGPNVSVPSSLISILKSAHSRGARIASICSGAFVLAATGLLDGRRAATHWRYATDLRKYYPNVTFASDVLYIEDERIFTSAGSAAGIDLMLRIVQGDFGTAAANSVARRLVMHPHRSGSQFQYIDRPIPRDNEQRMLPLLDLVREDLSRSWTISNMAEHVSMSPRTLIRRFRELTGQSPLQWIAVERLQRAKLLLETSTLSIERIATDVGLGSPQALRHHFRQQLGTSPREHRLNSQRAPAYRPS